MARSRTALGRLLKPAESRPLRVEPAPDGSGSRMEVVVLAFFSSLFAAVGGFDLLTLALPVWAAALLCLPAAFVLLHLAVGAVAAVVAGLDSLSTIPPQRSRWWKEKIFLWIMSLHALGALWWRSPGWPHLLFALWLILVLLNLLCTLPEAFRRRRHG